MRSVIDDWEEPSPTPNQDELLRQFLFDYNMNTTVAGMDEEEAFAVLQRGIQAIIDRTVTERLREAIVTTWYYTGEGYNGEYDGLTHIGGKRYTDEEVLDKVVNDVMAQLRTAAQQQKGETNGN